MVKDLRVASNLKIDPIKGILLTGSRPVRGKTSMIEVDSYIFVPHKRHTKLFLPAHHFAFNHIGYTDYRGLMEWVDFYCFGMKCRG